MKCFMAATDSYDDEQLTISQWLHAVSSHNLWRPKVSEKAHAVRKDKVRQKELNKMAGSS